MRSTECVAWRARASTQRLRNRAAASAACGGSGRQSPAADAANSIDSSTRCTHTYGSRKRRPCAPGSHARRRIRCSTRTSRAPADRLRACEQTNCPVPGRGVASAADRAAFALHSPRVGTMQDEKTLAVIGAEMTLLPAQRSKVSWTCLGRLATPAASPAPVDPLAPLRHGLRETDLAAQSVGPRLGRGAQMILAPADAALEVLALLSTERVEPIRGRRHVSRR